MADEEKKPEQSAVPPKLNLKAKVAGEEKSPASQTAGAPETPSAATPKPLAIKPPSPTGAAGAKPLAIKPPEAPKGAGDQAKPQPLTAKPPEATQEPRQKPGPSLNLAAAAGLEKPAPTEKETPAATPKPLAVKPPTPTGAAGAKPLTIKPPAAAQNTAAPKPLAVKPPEQTAAAAPKPLAVKPPAAQQTADDAEDTRSQTMEIKLPGGATPKKKETSRIPLDVAKRQTSRIPLETAKTGDLTRPPVKPDESGAEAPKTIRIKPATASQTKTASSPGAAKAETSNLEAAKRKTSRISLESAIQSPSEEAGPKTIKLKRPSEAPTIKVAKAPAAESAAPQKDESDVDEAVKGKTARLDIPDEDNEPDVSPTRKKTIRVKRPSAAETGPKDVTPAKGSPAERAALAAANQNVGEKEPHGTFSFIAVAAIFVCIVCIYLFCSQALGPNASLTQLSYGAPGTDLPWPGKIGIR